MRDPLRFALTASDRQGRRQQGQVVLAGRWQGEWGSEPLPEGAAFLIVVLEVPPSQPPVVTSPCVAVCLPRDPLPVSFAVHERQAPYARGAGDVVELREGRLPLPADAISSFLRGEALTAVLLGLKPEDVFDPTREEARLGPLASALLERARRPTPALSQAQLRALAHALAAPHEPGIEAADAAAALAKLRRLLAKTEAALQDKMPSDSPPAPVSRLRLVAATGTAQATAPGLPDIDPTVLAEDVFFCRCLLNDAAATLAYAAMRAHLDDVVVPTSMEELAIDRRVTQEQLSYASLLFEPHRAQSTQATFEFFQKRFVAAYMEHHSRYREGLRHLLEELRGLETCAAALRRLNQLTTLGRPLGVEALDAYEKALTALQPCPIDSALTEALRQSPFCPVCRLTLADEPPSQHTQRIAARLHRALRQQQTRLAEQVIKQILATRDEKRVELFLKIVQATQLRGIAEVLDDDLVAFLRELLEQPSGSEETLLERFTRLFPVVTEDSLDAAVEGFRRLLEEGLAAEKTRSKAGPAALNLSAGVAPTPE